ncbi:hypothetical protein H2248_000198 [Termitomyces sp. 'cryptogamus']|nr:hypothetical protein H2248_000198 [Termitomyces sp. 'cryptogamus']
MSGRHSFHHSCFIIPAGHHGWLHWFDAPIPDGGRVNIDLWPDVSSYSPSELFPAPGLKTGSGEQVFLFSSRHPKTVQRHFRWMAEHGVDGAFLQRFAGQCDLETGNEGIRRIRDEVGDRVREAAEKEGRTFAIMYDVSGVPDDCIQRVLERDWVHLIRNLGVLDSPNYLREKGKAVVALWGFGFENAGHTPALVRAITTYIRNVTPGGAYIMAGTPAHWRTATSDADRNPEFLDVWLNEFDAISPWTVGRYGNEKEADNFAETKMKGDVELIKKRNEEGCWRKIDYIPVVLPGGSGFNLSQGKWGFNDIKRNGGRFLWQQIFNAKHLGVRTMYGAMWDEYDEGTAFMPVIEKKRMLPVSDRYPFLALDEDGYNLPSDWYMRICGFAAEGLRSERQIFETFPSKELEDYWSSRPKYETVDPKSGDFVSGASRETKDDGFGGGDGMSYQEWLAAQKEDKEEQPPPPYSLEAEEPSIEPLAVADTHTIAVSAASASLHMASTPTAAPVVTEIRASSSQATSSTATSRPAPKSPSHAGSILQTTGPPPINTGSRPHRHHHSISSHTYPTGHDQTSPTLDRTNTYSTHASLPSTTDNTSAVHDPVASLVNNFNRHGLGPVDPRPTASSPPPVHASRPSTAQSNHHHRPESPYSHSPSQAVQSSSPTPGSSSQTQASIGQWPPPEWGTENDPRHQLPPPANELSYPGNLTRPQALVPSPYPPHPHSAVSIRPLYSTSGGTSAPGHAGGPSWGPAQSAYTTTGPLAYPPESPPFPSIGGVPSFPQGPDGESSYPSAYSSTSGLSTYSGQMESSPYTPSGHLPPASHSPGFGGAPHMAPSHSPGSGQSYYPGQTAGYGFPVAQSSSYPGSSSYGAGSQSSYGTPHGMPYLPDDGPVQGGGFHMDGDSHFGGSQPQSSGYVPCYISGSTPYDAFNTMSPSPSWYPGSSSTPAPPPVHPGREPYQPTAFPNRTDNF